MTHIYSLRIRFGSDVVGREISRIMNQQSTRAADGVWELELVEQHDDPYVDFVGRFSALLAPHLEDLERIGVQQSDISVWVLYEYDSQCNLEFRADDIASLAKLGVALCISCWQSSGVEAEAEKDGFDPER